MKKITLHKGFTLIELLVVVAIIGLLAATILASLGQARGKAKLARAKSEISSMRAAAELYASSSSNGYEDVFGDDVSGMSRLVTSVEGAFTGTGVISKNDTVDSWAFSLIDGDVNFCADSTGFAGELANPQPVGNDDDLCNTP